MVQSHVTTSASELQVRTPPPGVQLGAKPEITEPRPDLAGLRVKSPNAPQVYLIDPDGYRRWIPNPPTYNNLFRDWNGIITDIDTNEISEASPLTDGAVLARGIGTAPVYLVSNGMKRWITSPTAMDKYYFNWNTVVQIPSILVDSIPTGSPWS